MKSARHYPTNLPLRHHGLPSPLLSNAHAAAFFPASEQMTPCSPSAGRLQRWVEEAS